MSKHWNIGYALTTNTGGSEFWYKQLAVQRRIVVACGKGIVGSWLGFECHYQYDGYFANNGLQEDYQKLLGVGFSGANVGIWLGDTNDAGQWNIVWAEPKIRIHPRIATGTYYGSVSLSVITHLGGDYYNVNAVISVKGAVYSHTYANVYIPSTYTNTVVIGCMNGFGTGGTQAHIYNIQVPDNWKFTLSEASVTPKKALCIIGKKSATGPNFKISNYNALVNSTLSEKNIIIGHGGYTASRIIPSLGAEHHIIQKYVSKSTFVGTWTNYIGWYGENDTTLHGDVLISGSTPSQNNCNFYAWAHTQAGSTIEDLPPEYTYPNTGTLIQSNENYVRWVSIRRVFDDELYLGKLYSTVIVDVYDESNVYIHHQYRSYETPTGNNLRFVSQVDDPNNLITITTEHEQFIATSGLEDDCRGMIISDFSYEITNTLNVQFTNTTISVNEIQSYLWDFGDGETSTDQNPAHTFVEKGGHHVTLTVSGADGESSVTKLVIAIQGSAKWGPAQNYLIQQYKESGDVSSLISMHERRMSGIAGMVEAMPIMALSVDFAEGTQLDNIGKTVDAGRGSLTDAQYRDNIKFIQRVNAAGGEPEIIIEYIKRHCGSDFSSLLFDEGGSSVTIQLITRGVVPAGFLEELVYQLSRIVPAAVEVRLFHSEDGDIFSVADEGGIVTAGAGFSEEDNEYPYTSRTTGGRFIDPIHI